MGETKYKELEDGNCKEQRATCDYLGLSAAKFRDISTTKVFT